MTTIDSPDQGGKGIAGDKTTIKGNEILVAGSRLGLVYKASYNPQRDKLKGTFI